jgi:acylphosphatase
VERIKIQVYGDVQGVFYRHFTKKKATSLNLTGWCRNEADGSVLIFAEGEKEAISQLVEWCHQGSPMARVKEIKTNQEESIGEEKGFEIR